jgi:hypothetical protein
LVGAKSSKDGYIFAGQIATVYYFLFFLVFLPLSGIWETLLTHSFISFNGNKTGSTLLKQRLGRFFSFDGENNKNDDCQAYQMNFEVLEVGLPQLFKLSFTDILSHLDTSHHNILNSNCDKTTSVVLFTVEIPDSKKLFDPQGEDKLLRFWTKKLGNAANSYVIITCKKSEFRKMTLNLQSLIKTGVPISSLKLITIKSLKKGKSVLLELKWEF